MLGGAWMLSFLGPIGAEVVQNGLGSKQRVPALVMRVVESLPDSLQTHIMDGMGLDFAFMVTAIVLAVAGCVTIFLPHALIVRSAD